MEHDGRPSLTEIPGAVVGGITDSLKGSPMLMVIVVMNLATIGMLFYFSSEISKSRSEIITKLIDKCTYPTPRHDMDMLSPPARAPAPIDVKKEE